LFECQFHYQFHLPFQLIHRHFYLIYRLEFLKTPKGRKKGTARKSLNKKLAAEIVEISDDSFSVDNTTDGEHFFNVIDLSALSNLQGVGSVCISAVVIMVGLSHLAGGLFVADKKLAAEIVEISDDSFSVDNTTDNQEANERKKAFLQSNNKSSNLQKTSQSTLSFTKGGLQMTNKTTHMKPY
jgi:hypothetical protein